MAFDAWQQEVETIGEGQAAITQLATTADASKADAVIDTICAALGGTSPDSPLRLQYWRLLDRLCKVNDAFIGGVKKRFVATACEYAPAKSSTEFAFFLQILDGLRHILGSAMVAVAKARMGITTLAQSNDDDNITFSNLDSQASDRAPRALVVHRAALSTMGGFMTRKDNTQRSGPPDALQVRTRDSLTAMKAANAYAPAMAVEIAQAPVQSDVDAPAGFRQALPANHTEEYRRMRQKRLRETFEQAHKDEEDRKNKKAVAELERQTAAASYGKDGAASTSSVAAESRDVYDFSDVVIPDDLPRDEYGVQIANFPLGVRFLREAILSCGGALELETIVQRLSTLSGFDKDKFGNVREFVSLHTPTFLVKQEKDKWVVRVKSDVNDDEVPPSTPMPDGNFYLSWERMYCPLCGKDLKGRNLARHANCRGCIKAQVAKIITGHPTSDIGLLHAIAQEIMSRHSEAVKDGYSLVSGAVFDDGDLEYFESCLVAAAKVKRYQLSTTRHFLLVLKAIGIVRARWLAIHNVKEIKDIQVGPSDQPFVRFFGTLGSLVHRLPIAWIEMGDIVDMCGRFTPCALPAHNPPPRPADPRIQMTNEYPGILFCDSEIDSEDEVSAEDDEACSDDEQEQFVLAPPVSVVESLMTVGFQRDTKRLEYRLRTRPPMVLRKALKLGGNATQSEAYHARE
eukprot:GILI01013806.1.p1 GENE.GILI01013806.1~~GILI01013806.1.p1  ORF type:complete len:685 (-),score=125.95 GILI01013806.1:66-2120(-)